MTTDPTPDNPELTRLLDAYNDAAIAYGEVCGSGIFRVLHEMDDARFAVDAYIAANYTRRDRLPVMRLADEVIDHNEEYDWDKCD